MEVNILLDNGLEGKLDISWLRQVTEKVLNLLDVGSNVELGLFIAAGERVRRLNQEYLGRDEMTDVLAFSAREEAGAPFVHPPDGLLHLGEVIISYPQAVKQAKEYKHSLREEILLLIIHGILHLLGYEDNKPGLRRRMRAKEKELMSLIGGLR